MTNDATTLGHFLGFDLWQQALKLLNFQIECQATNKHFKTPSMIYYQRLRPAVQDLDSEDYFTEKVASNLFYGLEEEFAVHPYVVPKAGLGLRSYRFFTYPMRALYYAVGLYLLRLSKEFLDNFYKTRQRLRSYYGGNLCFTDGKLRLTQDDIYFKKHYTDFRNCVRRQTVGDVSNTIVVRLDIQNCYEEISVPMLLALLNRDIKPSQIAAMSFDTATREQIAFFFRFLADGGKGIPQCDNSLVSSFIGHLYLVFADLLVEGELYKDMNVIEEYSLTRYVDDTFISITFKGGIADRDQREYAESLGARVADKLYYELGLRLNPKTRFFCLGDEHQLEDLLSSLKKVSPEYHLSDDQEDEPPRAKVDSIFHELNRLKKASIQPDTFEHEVQDEILKEVFDKHVNEMLAMDVNQRRIRRTFSDFDFNRVKEYPLPIMIVLLRESKTATQFREFLLHKQNLTTGDVDLILTYLCQVDLQDWDLLSRLGQYAPMGSVIGTLKKASLSSDFPGYYDLPAVKAARIAQMPYVIEQIRHRVFYERTESYSVALNHLLNEIHAVCYELDTSADRKDYDANGVIRFLDCRRVSPDICVSIRNLFDRRNTNQVSHPGSEENVTWGVAEEEYSRYRSQVGRCLAALL